MDKTTLKNLLLALKNGDVSIENAIDIISEQGILKLEHSNIDIERKFRTGFPEIIFCESKTVKEINDIIKSLKEKNHQIILTRLKEDQIKNILKEHPYIKIFERARIGFYGKEPIKTGLISVISGGTSDIPVAEEAAVTAELLGCNVGRFYDVGVAGLHRILEYKEDIEKSNVIIAVAGMEGALPSVAGGIFGGPIIAVPTSVGYGTNLSGLAPLLAMLNSCSPGVAVVNIDNGFGAGFMASIINKRIEDARKKV